MESKLYTVSESVNDENLPPYKKINIFGIVESVNGPSQRSPTEDWRYNVGKRAYMYYFLHLIFWTFL